MPEFTIHVDSVPGALRSEDELGRLDERMRASEALGPAVGLSEGGVAGATFQLEQPSAECAALVGGELFVRALLFSGASERRACIDRLEVERNCRHAS